MRAKRRARLGGRPGPPDSVEPLISASRKAVYPVCAVDEEFAEQPAFDFSLSFHYIGEHLFTNDAQLTRLECLSDLDGY